MRSRTADSIRVIYSRKESRSNRHLGPATCFTLKNAPLGEPVVGSVFRHPSYFSCPGGNRFLTLAQVEGASQLARLRKLGQLTFNRPKAHHLTVKIFCLWHRFDVTSGRVGILPSKN